MRNLKVQKILFCLFIMTSILLTSSVTILNIPETSPIRSVHILKDGTEIQLPAYFESNVIAIIGMADVDALNDLQRGMDSYRPLEFLGKGICFLWLIENTDESDLGAYKEVTFIHLGTRNNAALKQGTDVSNIPQLFDQVARNEDLAFISSAVWLDSDLAIEAGRQIWGYPKLKAELSEEYIYCSGKPIRILVTVTDTASGCVVLQANLPVRGIKMKPQLPPSMAEVTTGDWEGEYEPHEIFSSFTELQSLSFRYWDPIIDRLHLGQGTLQIDMVKALRFVPIVLMYYKGLDTWLSEPFPL